MNSDALTLRLPVPRRSSRKEPGLPKAKPSERAFAFANRFGLDILRGQEHARVRIGTMADRRSDDRDDQNTALAELRAVLGRAKRNNEQRSTKPPGKLTSWWPRSDKGKAERKSVVRGQASSAENNDGNSVATNSAVPKPYVSIAELAKLTPWTQQAIRTMISRGVFIEGKHYFHVGRRTVFKWAEVCRFIDDGVPEAAPDENRVPHYKDRKRWDGKEKSDGKPARSK